MAFPGGPGGMPGMPGMNPNAGMSEQEQQMIKFMQASMESCAGKTVMAGVMGGGLGAMFGLFMASMRYDTPMGQPPMPMPPNTTPTTTPNAANAKPTIPTSTVSSSATPSTPTPSATSTSAASTPAIRAPVGNTMYNPISPTADLPLRQQLKIGLRDMYRSSISSGRNFALVGSIFSGTECAIEGLRAKNDIWNGVAGGCITGGVLARKAGPQAVAVGCLGFAGFSAAIDAYMRMPEDERSRPIG